MATTPYINRKNMTRRRMLGAALAAVPLAAVAGPAWADPAAAARTARRLTLPAPTGPHPVGTAPLHLVDRSRPDGIAGPGHFRELMATVWYPARNVERYPVAPWMPAGALQAFLDDTGFGALAPLGPLTAGHVGAPVRRSGRRLPVVVFSHGAHSHQGDHTVMVQELASHGFAVVTVAHQYDTYTEFPDGRVAVPLQDSQAPTLPGDFAADLRFVLDCVEQLAAGCNPDAGRRNCRPGCSAPSTRGTWACSAGRRAGRPPPAPCSRTSASGPG